MRTLLACLILAAVPASPARAEDPKGDLAKVQGKWTGKVGPDRNIPLTMHVKDKAVTILITLDDREITLKGEIKLDETKSPKHWTWTKFKDGQGDDVEDNLGIYKIDGEELTLCSGGPGNDRPTKFEAGDSGFPNLAVLKKEKEKEKEQEKPKDEKKDKPSDPK